MIDFYCWKGDASSGPGFWIRILRRTYYFTLNQPVTFSERYGYRKVYRLGPLAFQTFRTFTSWF